jgi:asparagine synthase (glutamine-hydrolysing)
MVRTLQHRGPDDHGCWHDEAYGVAVAHQRLSILDISSLGHQPMVSRNGRFVIVFNGEIYNFQELRSQLVAAGQEFTSNSDTEVLLEAVAAWGIEDALSRLVGMYAFAVWDRDQRELVLARDRLGEKPLYYGWIDRSFVFASELKALLAHPLWKGVVDRKSLCLFLRYGYVPGPRSVYQGIQKLPPGCFLRFTPDRPTNDLQPSPYWRLEELLNVPLRSYEDDTQAIDELERLLTDAIQKQMVADVPLGAFLSGGIDSATVVALMQNASPNPVQTYAIGVNHPNHDEAPAARAIAKHLGTEHTEKYIHPDDALAVIPELAHIYDEPFADSSQIPTILVSRLARRHVAVSLSGDGGDELFAGYRRYESIPSVVSRLGKVPRFIRNGLGRIALSKPGVALFDAAHPFDGGRYGDRIRRLGEILTNQSPLSVHRAVHSNWPVPQSIVKGGDEPPTMFTTDRSLWRRNEFGQRMLAADAVTYLPDDLLVKVDRAAMNASLETRIPMLDHRIVEFAMRLPWEMKVRNGVRKWILRQVLYRHVPRDLVDRPKKGFSIPIGTWLRGPLRKWADDLLDRERIEAEGFFCHEPIAFKWREHQRGKFDWSDPLWTILMFQTWYQSQLREPQSADKSQLLRADESR